MKRWVTVGGRKKILLVRRYMQLLFKDLGVTTNFNDWPAQLYSVDRIA